MRAFLPMTHSHSVSCGERTLRREDAQDEPQTDWENKTFIANVFAPRGILEPPESQKSLIRVLMDQRKGYEATGERMLRRQATATGVGRLL